MKTSILCLLALLATAPIFGSMAIEQKQSTASPKMAKIFVGPQGSARFGSIMEPSSSMTRIPFLQMSNGVRFCEKLLQNYLEISDYIVDGIRYKKSPFDEDEGIRYKKSFFDENEGIRFKKTPFDENEGIRFKKSPFDENEGIRFKKSPFNENEGIRFKKSPFDENEGIRFKKSPFDENEGIRFKKSPFEENEGIRFKKK